MTQPAIYALSPQNDFEGRGEAYVWGDLDGLAKQVGGPLVRMHSRCMYGDVFGSVDCDCRDQLDSSKDAMSRLGGVLFYLQDHEGRGLGTLVKAEGYVLKDTHRLGTVAAYKELGVEFDVRQYGHCARFLTEHSIDKVHLLSNNLRKISALTAANITVKRQPLIITTNGNVDYQRIKRDQAGHLFPKSL